LTKIVTYNGVEMFEGWPERIQEAQGLLDYSIGTSPRFVRSNSDKAQCWIASSRSSDARVEFGDVRAHTTSEYRSVPGGVGEYAAFDFTLGDRPITQSVADFVGWRPLRGRAFTYEVRIVPGRTEPALDVTRVVRER